MDLYSDFKELLESFNERDVEYVIVGGYALAHHGAPRYTRDIDLYVHSSPDNAARIIAALDTFGFGSAGLKAKTLRSLAKSFSLDFRRFGLI